MDVIGDYKYWSSSRKELRFKIFVSKKLQRAFPSDKDKMLIKQSKQPDSSVKYKYLSLNNFPNVSLKWLKIKENVPKESLFEYFWELSNRQNKFKQNNWLVLYIPKVYVI